MSGRASPRGLLLITLVVSVALASACAPRQDPLVRRAVQEQRREALRQPPPPPRERQRPVGPPRTNAERRARARAALGPDRTLGKLSAVGDGTRFAFSLDRPPGAPEGHRTLMLFDIERRPGRLLGEHHFLAGQAPARIEATALVDAAGGPLVLASLRGGVDRPGPFGSCGWWLVGQRASWGCAPRAVATSRHLVLANLVWEVWETSSPTAPLRDAGLTGRVFEFDAGRWRELDEFRCLGMDLQRALDDAGSPFLSSWQIRRAERLLIAATDARTEGDASAAYDWIQAALEIDGCAAETWRRSGRLLRDENGPAVAAPTLAVALALSARNPGALLDLADVLTELDEVDDGESWRLVRQILAGRKGLRPLIYHDDDSPTSILETTIRTYRRYLALTRADAKRHFARRQRVRAWLRHAGVPIATPGAAPAQTPRL